MTDMLKISVAALLLCTALPSRAYHFTAESKEGTLLYFNMLTRSEVELTYAEKYRSTESYAGRVTVPETVADAYGNPYKVVAVGERAMQGCADLDEIILPPTVVSIGRWAFAGCSSLTAFSVPASTTEISPGAFDGCFSLAEFTVEKGNEAFSTLSGTLTSADRRTLVAYPPGLDGEYRLPPNIQALGEGAFYGCTFIPHVRFNSSLREIGKNAFYFCNGLESVDIPASVTEIADGAFADCFGLRSIDVDPANPVYSSADGLLMSADRATLLQAPAAMAGEPRLPEEVTRIAPKSFMRSYGLTGIQLPEGTASIGEAAFVDCRGMLSVTIPQSVSEISDMAFGMCEALGTVYVSAPDPMTMNVSPTAFVSLNGISRTLVVPHGSADAYRCVEPWSDFVIVESLGAEPQEIEWRQDDDTFSADSLQLRLSARATSGLPVKYVLAPECQGMAEISGNKVTINTAGELTITAVQCGNLKYLPAQAVTHTYHAPNAIADPAADALLQVYSTGLNIIIRAGAAELGTSIYDVGGQLIYAGESRRIAMPSPGIYIVRAAGQAFKIYVRG